MLDEIRTDLEVARLSYEGALENKRLAAVELDRAQAQYGLRIIKSPLDGYVIERFLSEGEFAQAQAILTIASIDPLHVEVVAPIALYGAIKPGMKARVKPEAPLDGSYDATVKIVDRVVDAASGLFRIRLVLPNPKGRLPAGIECRVEFPTS
jgi:multidrug efflux pump subunit AcrA (membrane-fusion protein)